MKGFCLFVISVSLFLGTWGFPGKSAAARNWERIVGGNETTIEKYPFIAQLHHNNRFYCGSCIISPKWVITAGHATFGQTIETVTLRVGATPFNQSENEAITLAEIHLHPLYNSTTFDYDISILLLNEKLVFGDTIAPISLPGANVVLPVGTMTTIIGWGDLAYQGAKPTQLMVVNVPIISNEECAGLYENSTTVFVTDRVLCALYPGGGKDACNGDSGGPLVVDNLLYGLVSSGEGCADARFPGTYTNVSSLRNYIEEITGL